MLTITNNKLSAVIDDAKGGSLRRFDRRRGEGAPIPVFRPAAQYAVDPRYLASFPLVPFSNRIVGGVFRHGDQDVRMTPNNTPEPHRLHGYGWLLPWTVTAQTAAMVELRFDWPGGEWPWRFRASQQYRLDGDTLEVALSLTNTASTAMPAGLGHHPYFPRPAGTEIRFDAQQVWHADAAMVPTERTAVPDSWSFREQRPVDGVVLDNCFADWDGRYAVTWPNGIQLDATADAVFGHLVVYVPTGKPFMAIEPVTHVNDAVHLAQNGVEGTGFQELEPGATLSGTMRFTVRD